MLERGDDRYYLYAPLRRGLAVVNGAAARVVARYLDGGIDDLPPPAVAVIEQLTERGLLGSSPPKPPLFPDDYTFQPHEVTLFPTTRCNLRCRYCYADAGHRVETMPWEIARAAIDRVASNAGLLGAPRFGVGFHGGGEPLLEWEFVVRCVEHARRAAADRGLDADIYAATNGLLTAGQRAFVAEHFSTVNISLDGPPDIQDRNRPRVDGGGSYAGVAATLRDFDARGMHYGVRSTVTRGMVERLVEVVEHLHGEFGLAYLHLEPVWNCGRCRSSGTRPPDADEFVRHFVAASERGRELGLEVHYSGARIDVLTSRFCAAPGDGFSVLPDGRVSSCYEVLEPSDPRAEVFHYGHFDGATGEFVFDTDRLARLQGFSVEHLEYCADCFCKWHCAGDCLAKVFERCGRPHHEGSDRCQLNRELTLAALDRLIQNPDGDDATASRTRGGG